jgi:hypothetical protein
VAAADGPWRIQLLGDANKRGVVLELLLPLNYPSKAAPSPLIHAPPWVLNESYAADLVKEMVEMWSEDTEVSILWAEHCWAAIDNNNDDEGNDHQVKDEEEPKEEINETKTVEDEGIDTNLIFY